MDIERSIRNKWYEENYSRLKAESDKRRRATGMLNRAIRKGDIERKPCEICGGVVAEGHHENYDNPLDVVWLCKKHHTEKHVEKRQVVGGRRPELKALINATKKPRKKKCKKVTQKSVAKKPKRKGYSPQHKPIDPANHYFSLVGMRTT